MSNHNLSNLNYKFIECEEDARIVKTWFEQKYVNIEDIVDDYLMMRCHRVKDINRDFLECLAIMIGIMDIFNYKTKSILLREIHKRWLNFFYENKNQVEDYLNYHNPELLEILNTRLQR